MCTQVHFVHVHGSACACVCVRWERRHAHKEGVKTGCVNTTHDSDYLSADVTTGHLLKAPSPPCKSINQPNGHINGVAPVLRSGMRGRVLEGYITYIRGI